MIGRRLIFFDKPLQRSNLCASHRQRRWLTHGELEERLTHEYSKLAGQYAQEQKELSAQVESLGKQVRRLADQSHKSGKRTPSGRVRSWSNNNKWAHMSRP